MKTMDALHPLSQRTANAPRSTAVGLGKRVALLLCGLGLLACAGSQTTSEEPTDGQDADSSSGPRNASAGVGVEAEIGALSESEVKSAFNGSMNGISACFRRGTSKLPYLSGTIRVAVRVASSGTVSVYLKSSDLGDLETERCMVGVFRGRSWPTPVGGKEGFAENDFTFDPQDNVRMPVEWSSADAGKGVDEAQKTLSECRRSAKLGKPLSATLYVDPEGAVKSVGVGGDDRAVDKAADCVTRGISAIKFNSPGSFDAKLTIHGS